MSDREGGDADLSLPKATIQKIVNEILGDKSGIGFNREARDLLIDCCVEFVTLISSEANELADTENKKTISVEHIEKALKELGFLEYVKEVLVAAGDQKEQLKNREKRTSKAATSGFSQEELAAQQAALFAGAASKYNSTD